VYIIFMVFEHVSHTVEPDHTVKYRGPAPVADEERAAASVRAVALARLRAATADGAIDLALLRDKQNYR